MDPSMTIAAAVAPRSVVDVSTDTIAIAGDASLIVGVVVDSGEDVVEWWCVAPNKSRSSSVCSGAVNGTTICSTNHHATS